jgi:hypothetical protein
MAWTTPLTAVANASLTAAQWNASVRDNLLTTAPALATTAGSFFATTAANSIAERIPTANSVTGSAETTTSTSYTATLSGGAGTSGPAVTLTTGPKALIAFHCRQSTSISTTNVWSSVAVSGASAISASDNWALSMDIVSSQIIHGMAYLEPNLTAGSNTFTQQYRVSAGTGTFAARRINVVPF